jgi:hypothetical protein
VQETGNPKKEQMSNMMLVLVLAMNPLNMIMMMIIYLTREDLRKDFLFLFRFSLPNVMKPNKRLANPMNKPSKASWLDISNLSLLRRNN